jgi:hypothetical protein
MTLVKTVEMRVLADAGNAQAKLDELDAKAKDLDAKDLKMRFRLEDGNAKGQMDEIRAKADELGLKDVRISVKVDGAGRAIADLMAVRHEEDKLRDKKAENAAGGLLGSLGGIFSAGPSLPEGIPLIGGMGPAGLAALVPAAAAALVEITGLVSGFAAAGAGAGAFAALAIPAVKSVQAAYQSVTAAQKTYSQAQAKLGTAELTEKLAPSKQHLKDVQSALLGVKVAMIGVHDAESKLSPVQRNVIFSIRQAATTFGQMSKAFQPQVFKIFGDGLRIVNHLLPSVTPFANTFANVLDGLLKKADKFTQSTGFQKFLQQFHSLEGPALNSIGTGIGNVVNAIGKLLTSMSGKDVAHAINIAFGGISGTINAVTATVKAKMKTWDSISHGVSSTFDADMGSIKGAIHSVASAFDSARHSVASWADQVIHDVGAIPGKIKGFFAGAAGWLVDAGRNVVMGLVHGIEGAAGAVSSAIGHIASEIRSFLPFSPAKKGPLSGQGSPEKAGQKITAGIVTGLQGGQGAINAAMTAIGNTVAGPDSAIAAAIGKLKTLVSGSRLGTEQKLLLTTTLELDNNRLQALAARRKMIETEIQQSEQVAQNEIQNNSIMNSATAGPDPNAEPISSGQLISGLQYQTSQVKQFAAAIRQLKAEGLNATSLSQIIQAGSAQGLPVAQALLSGGRTAISQINALEKQLRASAGKLGDAAAGPMYQAGVQAAQGLAAGLKSQLGTINSAMKQLADQIASAIRKALKSHSPSLLMAEIGETIPQGVALGIDRGAHLAAASSARLAASTVQPWAGAGHGGRGGGDLHVHFHGVFAGDKYGTAQQVHTLLRDYKRNRGNAALGLG